LSARGGRGGRRILSAPPPPSDVPFLGGRGGGNETSRPYLSRLRAREPFLSFFPFFRRPRRHFSRAFFPFGALSRLIAHLCILLFLHIPPLPRKMGEWGVTVEGSHSFPSPFMSLPCLAIRTRGERSDSPSLCARADLVPRATRPAAIRKKAPFPIQISQAHSLPPLNGLVAADQVPTTPPSDPPLLYMSPFISGGG